MVGATPLSVEYWYFICVFANAHSSDLKFALIGKSFLF